MEELHNRVIETYVLTELEQEIVQNLVAYAGMDDGSWDFRNVMLVEMKMEILRRRGYEEGLGQCQDWNDQMNGIDIIYSPVVEEREKNLIRSFDDL